MYLHAKCTETKTHFFQLAKLKAVKAISLCMLVYSTEV